jgi:hypothetical protein
VAYAAGDHASIGAACQAFGSGYEDVRNMLKKWRKEGTLDANVEAHQQRKPVETKEKAAMDRKAVLDKVQKAMKLGKLSARGAAVECQALGVAIQKSTLSKRKLGITVNDGPGAPAKLPPTLVEELVKYIEVMRVTFRIPVFTCQVRRWVQQMITGTKLAEKFKEWVLCSEYDATWSGGEEQ